MCVHEPVKRVLIFVMAKILGMNTDALRANLVYAMLVTVVTVAICVTVHLIMGRFAPVLIGSSRHNLASQGNDGRTFAVGIIVAMERRFVVVIPVRSRHLDFALPVNCIHPQWWRQW